MEAKKPFRFFTRQHLTELTGLRACDLAELLALLKTVNGSCIYHHTHRFLQQHQHLSPEPPNDFAYWVTESLGDGELGEKLASIDTVSFDTIRQLREKLIETVSAHIRDRSESVRRTALRGQEFFFMKSVSFILPTHYEVNDLEGFIETMGKITSDSIYFHVFEARLRMEKDGNDFANWVEDALDDGQTAALLGRLDPYTYTMEDLRRTIIRILKGKLVRESGEPHHA